MASIRQRKWTTSAGRRKAAWVVDYKDPIGKRRRVTAFKNKADAAAYLRQVRTAVDPGIQMLQTTTMDPTINNLFAEIQALRADVQELRTVIERLHGYHEKAMNGSYDAAASDKSLDIHEVAALFDVSHTTIRNRLKSGTIPPPDVGHLRWSENLIMEVIEKLPSAAIPQSRICAFCNAAFETKIDIQRYCSVTCRNKAKSSKAIERLVAIVTDRLQHVNDPD